MNAAVVPSQSSFSGVGGLKIHTRSWRPSEGMPRAVVVLSHGFNSHSGQYQWAAEQLVAAGMVVHALDHRGRGRSEGERFYVERFSDYIDDLTTFIRQVKAREPGLPVFLLGHSAGGVIACAYAVKHPSELRGLICESFAFQVPAPDLALAALKGLSRLVPHFQVLKLRNEDFSRDPAVVAALDADPLIADETQPTQTVAEMVRATEQLRLDMPSIKLPLLILHGTLDKATRPSGSQFFYDNAGSPDKTLKLYEGHFHDLLGDLGRDEVMADIRGWIEAHSRA
jgi:acylglycerol lipase